MSAVASAQRDRGRIAGPSASFSVARCFPGAIVLVVVARLRHHHRGPAAQSLMRR
jgi:hypothetical protein